MPSIGRPRRRLLLPPAPHPHLPSVLAIGEGAGGETGGRGSRRLVGTGLPSMRFLAAELGNAAGYCSVQVVHVLAFDLDSTIIRH
jgi:hypothetical protein